MDTRECGFMGCGKEGCEDFCIGRPEYEYGVRWKTDGYLHRSNLTLEQALEFIEYADGEGIPSQLFEVVRRPYGVWEVYGLPRLYTDDKGRPRHTNCTGRVCKVLNCRESFMCELDPAKPVNLPSTFRG